jgi:DNA adenine methylase
MMAGKKEFDRLKVPFPWFGGKQHAAPIVWAALGDVTHYVEPFAGSMAVLLRRPHVPNRTYFSETVNDIDGLLVNAWRAIQHRPDETAEAASWPVSEADLHARHLWLLRWKQENDLERLMGDPDYCDPKAAGWWLWGQSSWIGSGWCSGQGPWIVENGRMVRRPKNGGGVRRQLPHLGDDGRGVNTAAMREPGCGDEPEFHEMTMPELRLWFRFLAARLRHVRILNGDWTRAVTGGATKTIKVRMGGKDHAGIFLDPPYADTADRTDALYSHDSLDVAHAVREWAIKNGDDPQLRIVLAGFEGEHDMPAGWRSVPWYKGGFLRGGMGNTGKGTQMHRDRLWLSPHCLSVDGADGAAAVDDEDDAEHVASTERQGSLFGGV